MPTLQKPPILYAGADIGIELPTEILDKCEETRCDLCRVPVRVVSLTLSQSRALATRVGRRLDIVCNGCFRREAAKAEELIVAKIVGEKVL